MLTSLSDERYALHWHRRAGAAIAVALIFSHFFLIFSPRKVCKYKLSSYLCIVRKKKKLTQKNMKKAMYATVSVLNFIDPNREGFIYCRTFADKGRATRWANDESGKLADLVKTTVLRTVVTSDRRLSVAELEAAMSRDANDYTGVCVRSFWGGERTPRRQPLTPYFYALDYVKHLTE